MALKDQECYRNRREASKREEWSSQRDSEEQKQRLKRATVQVKRNEDRRR